jgi:hypothetical protein
VISRPKRPIQPPNPPFSPLARLRAANGVGDCQKSPGIGQSVLRCRGRSG